MAGRGSHPTKSATVPFVYSLITLVLFIPSNKSLYHGDSRDIAIRLHDYITHKKMAAL